MKERLNTILKFARKHLTPLILAAVALICVGLVFWPTGKLYASLQDELDQSSNLLSQIQGLLSKSRNLPKFDPNAPPAVLSSFPTQDVFNIGLAAVKKWSAESDGMLAVAQRINQHQPLVAGALPNGGDLERATFGRNYLAALQPDSNGNDVPRIRNWPPSDGSHSGIPALLAGRRLSDTELAAKLLDLQNQINVQYGVNAGGAAGGGTNGGADSTQDAQNAYAQASITKPLEWELDGAKKIKVYLEPGAIDEPDVYPEFQGATSSLPAAKIWSAQLSLWIDEDVATAVAYANASADNVTDSPIKQIDKLTVKSPPYEISGDPTAGKDNAPLTPVLDVTPTGRVCNGMYDVVQFNLSLEVDARRQAEVLGALEQHQFITVLSVQTTAEDSSVAALSRWVYGDAPIVRLDLACEELLLHSWTNALQPPDAGAAALAGPPGSTPTPAGPTTAIFPIITHAAQ
jgi:hypothetical protein